MTNDMWKETKLIEQLHNTYRNIPTAKKIKFEE